MKTMNIKKVVSMLLVLIMMMTAVVACGNSDASSESEGTDAASTVNVVPFGTETGKIDPDEVALKVGDIEIKSSELFYCYFSVKYTFEMYYGITDWAAEISEGYTYAEYLKSYVESQMLNIAFLLEKSQEFGIELTEEELASAKEEATAVYGMMTDEEKETFGFTEENLLEVSKHMMIANATMTKLQEDAEAALTEEELKSCNYRSIQHILISTMEGPAAEVAEGETVDAQVQEEYEAQQYELALEVYEKAMAGEDFETLANEYTADSGVGYAINEAGQTPDGATMVTEFAEAANALGEGEISEPVKTQFGYHIIKCVALEDAEAKAQAMSNLAYTNVSNIYSAWYESAKYTFSDTWTNYAIVNPEVIAETAAETIEETTEETETQAETAVETE